MGNNCYDTLLLTAREGRNKAKADQEIIELVNEIKKDFKGNDFSWNRTLITKRKYIEDKITSIIYRLYSNDIPSEASRLSIEERKLFLEKFQLLLNPEVRRKISIKVQGQNEESFFKLNQEQLLNASAYRILPKDYRRRYVSSSNLMARLTVNVNKENYNSLAKALIQIYEHDPQKRVIQAKIMGPRKLGNRTDQAVIYLSEASIETAKEVSQQLKALLPPDALIDHTPVGMKRLTKGISYSETVEGQSSSHGESRALIMAKAVTESLLTGERVKNTLPRALQRFGYDVKEPALISQAVKDSFLKNGLVEENIAPNTLYSSRDIQQFFLNPEQFCYGYKLNTNLLNDIKNIPENGKVIFYRNEKNGYDINYVDNTYSLGVPYTLDSYFLDTSLQDDESNFSRYIDIEKNSPQNKFLFLGEIKNGSIIITELDADNYRVYYDSRYDSSLLYDHVVMAIDERDYKDKQEMGNSIFLYFNENQWKLLLQKGVEENGLLFEPNNVTVQLPGAYSSEDKKNAFALYRKNIHEKLNFFADNLDVHFSTSEEYSVSEESNVNPTHWMNLANEVKNKLKVNTNALERKIDEININLEKVNDKKIISSLKESMEVSKVLDSIKNKQFNEIYSDLVDVEYSAYLQALKQKKGMDFVVKENKVDRQEKITVIERYENLLYLHKTTKNIEFRREFKEGMENYNNILINGFDRTLSSLELKKLYLTAELSVKERGALYCYIQDAGYTEYIDKILTETGRISEFFYENGSKANRLIPQDFYLSIIKSESGGRCYPLVRAMAVALAKNGQKGADKLIDKLYIAAANPDDKNSFFLKEGLKNLHSNTDAVEASYVYGKMSLNKIHELLEARDETMMFAVNSKTHSLLIGKKIEEGKTTYYFYDPNFGVFSFDDGQSLFSAVKKFFIEKQFAPYYSAFEIENKPAFNTVYLDTEKMRLVPIGNNLQVENLSEDEELTSAGVKYEKANILLKKQNEIYEDLQLKHSLMILDANQWAEKIHEATFKLSLENNLDGRWLPLFYNVKEIEEGRYSIQLIHLDDPNLTRWVETTDKTFKEFHQYSLDRMTEFGRYYHLIEDEFRLKPQSAEGNSIDGLNAGIAIQSIIQWVEDRNRTENTETKDTSNLATALRFHTYVNYALIAHSTAKDVAHVIQLVKTAYNYQTQTMAPEMTVFSSSLAKIANEGLSTLFNGALIGFDIYEVTQAENESQKITFGTQLAFDSASFMTSTAAIGSEAFGYATVSTSLGGMGVIIAGVGIGFTALARNFAVIGENAKAVGLYFSALDNAYKDNGYEHSTDNKILMPKFGAVFKTVDLQANQIEFDSQYIYRTSEKSSGGGRKNYIFWAGNFPTMVHDRQRAINIRRGIGYTQNTRTVNFSSQEMIFLPITPKSYIKYDYNLWPGATTRHDNGFDVIRRLEQTDNFDYDFYIFPSENTITHIYHEYVSTPVKVKLDSNNRHLIIPTLPQEWKGFIEYQLEGTGGKYRITLNEGVKISLKEMLGHNISSRWIFDATTLKDEKITLFDDKINIGGVDVFIDSQQPESKIIIITNKNEINEVEFKLKSIKVISEDESKWKENLSGFKDHLHQLAQTHKSHQQYIIIENYQHHGNNVGRAYYDVKNERFLFTHSTESEKSHSILGGVKRDTAIFYSVEHSLIWVTDINSGNILAEYRLVNKNNRQFEILKLWHDENAIYFSCRYQNNQEMANYQIIDGKIKLVSLTANSDLLTYLAITHTQLVDIELQEILQNYFIDNENNADKEYLKNNYLVDLVMISGNDNNQAYHRYWVRPHDNILIKPNLSPSLGFGYFPKDRKLKQSHWAIPEDLNLVGSLFDNDGEEAFYFYSDKQKLLYQQKGPGQDVLNVIKPSARLMYTPNLESVFIWQGNLMIIDSYGVISQIDVKDKSSVVALNDKWFQNQANWWQDLEYNYQDKVTLALLGIKDENNERVLPAWYIQGKVIIAHQLSSENELQFLGMNAGGSGAIIFDTKQKKLFMQPFATKKELTTAFPNNATLISPSSLPSIIDLYPNYRFNKIKKIAEGLLMSADSGEILYVDLLNNEPTANHLSSSLIIQGGKEHDILSPTVIKNVKNIVLSGGEGADSYLITPEAWQNYQCIFIDNNSYDEQEDTIILPAMNIQSLVTTRREDDLVIFDMSSSAVLVIRQLFGKQAKNHNHLKIRMHNQSYSMSLEEFTENTLHTEALFSTDKTRYERLLSVSEQQAQLVVENMSALDFEADLFQHESISSFPVKKYLNLAPPLLS